MTNKVNIAIDAMGGENSPKIIIERIKISLQISLSKMKWNFLNFVSISPVATGVASQISLLPYLYDRRSLS